MLSVVIPAYNEGSHIYENLGVISDALSKLNMEIEIVPVNDGSSDNTHEQIMLAANNPATNGKIHPVSYSDNKGKGGAIRSGVEAAKGDYIGFLDADLDISPDQIEAYVTELLNQQADVVIASKMHKDSKLEYPFARKVFSTGYYILLKILFGLKVKDTQTGIKIYKASYIKKVVRVQQIKGFAFDIDQLALVNNLGAQIKEMPIVLNYSREASFGRIRIKDIFKMFVDTFKIWWNLRIRKNYKY